MNPKDLKMNTFWCSKCDEIFEVGDHDCNASALARDTDEGELPVSGRFRETLFAGGTLLADRSRAERGSVWRYRSKAWTVYEYVPDYTRRVGALAVMHEVGGGMAVKMGLDGEGFSVDRAWTFLAADPAAFEKIRSESEASLKANPPKVKIVAAPKFGTVCEDCKADVQFGAQHRCGKTSFAGYNGTTNVLMRDGYADRNGTFRVVIDGHRIDTAISRLDTYAVIDACVKANVRAWLATQATPIGRVPEPGDVWRLNKTGADVTIVGKRSGMVDIEFKDGHRTQTWDPMDDKEWTFVRGAEQKPFGFGRTTDEADHETVSAVLAELRPFDRFELFGHKVTVESLTRTVGGEMPSTVTIKTDGGHRERLTIGVFARNACRVREEKPLRKRVDEMRREMDERARVRIAAVMVWRNLAEGFAYVRSAMKTPRGFVICRSQARADVLALRPKDLDPRGWLAVVGMQMESAGPCDGIDVFGMAKTIAACVSAGQRPYAPAYEAALKTPKRVEGPWRYRGKR